MQCVGITGAHPLVRLARIIQPQIVINRLRRENGRKAFGQRLQAIERTVPADRDESVYAELRQARGNLVEFVLLVRIDIIA